MNCKHFNICHLKVVYFFVLLCFALLLHFYTKTNPKNNLHQKMNSFKKFSSHIILKSVHNKLDILLSSSSYV